MDPAVGRVGSVRRLRVIGVALILAGVSEVLANLLERYRLDSSSLGAVFAIAPGWWRFELFGVLVIGGAAVICGVGVLRSRRLLPAVFGVLSLLVLTIGSWETPASQKPDSDFGLGAGTYATLLQLVFALVALWCAFSLLRHSGGARWTFDLPQVLLGLPASVCVVVFLLIDGWYRLDTHVIPEARRVELLGARVHFNFVAASIGGCVLVVLTALFLSLVTFAADRRISAWAALGMLLVQVFVYADEMRQLWWPDVPPGWGDDLHANRTLLMLAAGIMLLGLLSALQFLRRSE
jgi:hypothetical protein